MEYPMGPASDGMYTVAILLGICTIQILLNLAIHLIYRFVKVREGSVLDKVLDTLHANLITFFVITYIVTFAFIIYNTFSA